MEITHKQLAEAAAWQQDRISRYKKPQMSLDERTFRLHQLLCLPRWHQSIDCGADVVTPGMWIQPQIAKPLAALKLAGKRVLEVGALEGCWAYFAEDCDAREVLAIDMFPKGRGPDGFQARFWAMHEWRESAVHYLPCDVYDMSPAVLGTFDVINFCGIYYHLRHPLLAFERLLPLLRPDGVILCEGQYTPGDEAVAYLWHEQVLENDRTNWWTPTKQCLLEWFDATGFTCEELPSGHEPSAYKVTKGNRRLPIGRAVYYLRRK